MGNAIYDYNNKTDKVRMTNISEEVSLAADPPTEGTGLSVCPSPGPPMLGPGKGLIVCPSPGPPMLGPSVISFTITLVVERVVGASVDTLDTVTLAVVVISSMATVVVTGAQGSTVGVSRGLLVLPSPDPDPEATSGTVYGASTISKYSQVGGTVQLSSSSSEAHSWLPVRMFISRVIASRLAICCSKCLWLRLITISGLLI